MIIVLSIRQGCGEFKNINGKSGQFWMYRAMEPFGTAHFIFDTRATVPRYHSSSLNLVKNFELSWSFHHSTPYITVTLTGGGGKMRDNQHNLIVDCKTLVVSAVFALAQENHSMCRT